MNIEQRKRLVQAAMGQRPCDLTIKNIRFVNVFTGEIYPAEVDVADGYVARVRQPEDQPALPSEKIMDGENCYLIPGFIDAHMHVESTMLIPENFSRAAVPWGTTAICTDPHEIANVMGIAGVKFMLRNAKKSKLRQFVLAPSCVPAVPGLENSGAYFGEEEIEEILNMENVIGIAELMDYVGVCSGENRIHSIIQKGVEKNGFLQGHGPLLTGRELDAYAAAGISSDHESETKREIIEKLRVGMHINLRASSLVNHLEYLVDGIKSIPCHDFISVCTDDVHVADLLAEGHVNRIVGAAVRMGLEPVDVIRMATINAAREFGFRGLGAVAPGYAADMQLVKELDGSRPEVVFINGEIVAKRGRYLPEEAGAEECFTNTVQVSWMKGEEDFSLFVKDKEKTEAAVNVIVPLDESNVLRRVEQQLLPVRNGKICLDGREDLCFVCVCNRHGLEKKTVAVFQNFGLREGAVGTTVSHDSHNMVLVYRKEEDALCLLKELQRVGGGLGAAKDGQILSCVALPVAGLMSDKNAEEVSTKLEEYRRAFYKVCRDTTPLLSCAIMSLTALPGIIVTDCGLADGNTQEFIDILPSLD